MSSTDMSVKDLRRNSYPMEESIDNRIVVVYRMGEWDDTAPLSITTNSDVYYSSMVLRSFKPTISIGDIYDS